jgi:hypothetical protein
MADLLPVALGAGIALVASWGSEWLRYWFTRRHEREEQNRAFQREALMTLHGLLTEALRLGNRLHHTRKAENDWNSGIESEDEEALREILLDVRARQAFVDDEAVRTLVKSGVVAGVNLYGAKSEAESDAKRATFSKMYHAAIVRIGDLVRESQSKGRMPKATIKPAPRTPSGEAEASPEPSQERK